MRRGKCLVLLMAAVLTAMLILPSTVKAEEGKASKKIISIVYDDSGSMFDANSSWSSANYAMQAFAALLNSQDEMYITYMSDIMNGQYSARKVDLSDVEAAVNNIRGDVVKGGGTPLDAVEVAMDQLVSIKEDDENTQFWLVVLTDGAMSPLNSKTKHSRVKDALNDYAGTTMSNGSALYVNYLHMKDEANNTVSSDASKGLEAREAGKDIVPVLSDIANKISGRLKFEKDQITQVDGKTVKVHSDIPIYAISVFSQGSNATVTGAKAEADLTVDRNIALKYPELPGEQTNKNLYGNAAMINNGSGVIQSGDYTITFSEDISLENTVFMYQPAIKMKAVMTKNGVKVEDTSKLAIDETVDIEIIPTNPETGEEIKESDLPAGIKWKVSYAVDDQVVKEKDGKLLSDVTIQSGNNKIIASMTIPDYVPMTQTITFTPEIVVEYGIVADQPDESIFARSKMSKKNVKGGLVGFQITGNGEVLGKEDLKDIELEVKDISVDDSMLEKFYDKVGIKNATIELEMQDDGTYVMYPKGLGFPAFLLKAGQYTVTVCIDHDKSITASGTFMVEPSLADWIDLIKVLAVLLLILYLIYIFFIKAKFSGQTLLIEVYAQKGSLGEGKLLTTEGEEVVLKKFSGDLFLPKSACTKTVGGIKIIAGGNGDAFIKRSTVANYDAYGNSGANPLRNFNGVASALKKVQGNEDKIPEIIALGSSAFYLRQGKRLYKITMN